MSKSAFRSKIILSTVAMVLVGAMGALSLATSAHAQSEPLKVQKLGPSAVRGLDIYRVNGETKASIVEALLKSKQINAKTLRTKLPELDNGFVDMKVMDAGFDEKLGFGCSKICHDGKDNIIGWSASA